MFRFFKKKPTEPGALYAPVTGTVLPLSCSPDPAFAGGALGAGVLFRYEGNTVCAPCSGVVSAVASTGHSVAITTDEGAEVLLHVRVDTVDLNGNGFSVYVQKQQRISCGDRIIKIDRGYMEKKGIDLATCLTVTNSDEVLTRIQVESGSVVQGDTVVLRTGQR